MNSLTNSITNNSGSETKKKVISIIFNEKNLKKRTRTSYKQTWDLLIFDQSNEFANIYSKKHSHKTNIICSQSSLW